MPEVKAHAALALKKDPTWPPPSTFKITGIGNWVKSTPDASVIFIVEVTLAVPAVTSTEVGEKIKLLITGASDSSLIFVILIVILV